MRSKHSVYVIAGCALIIIMSLYAIMREDVQEITRKRNAVRRFLARVSEKVRKK